MFTHFLGLATVQALSMPPRFATVHTFSLHQAATRRASHVSACDVSYAASDWDDAWWEDGLTCVEFEAKNGETHLGVYVAYSVVQSEPHIRPLCASTEEEGVG